MYLRTGYLELPLINIWIPLFGLPCSALHVNMPVCIDYLPLVRSHFLSPLIVPWMVCIGCFGCIVIWICIHVHYYCIVRFNYENCKFPVQYCLKLCESCRRKITQRWNWYHNQIFLDFFHPSSHPQRDCCSVPQGSSSADWRATQSWMEWPI